MSLNADLREFIELLNSRGVEYVIVGAHSLAFHGRPRYTGDLDLLVRPSRENAAKLASLLHDFGFEKGDFAEADFTVPEQMIQLGRVPTRIDLLTSISGVIIEDAFRTKIFTEMEGLPVFILNKELLIQNKPGGGTSAGRRGSSRIRGELTKVCQYLNFSTYQLLNCSTFFSSSTF